MKPNRLSTDIIKEKNNFKPMNKRILFMIALLGILALPGFGQTGPNMFKTGGTNSIGPFLNNYILYRVQYLYKPSFFTNLQAGNIQKIYFRASSTNTAVYTGMTIRLGQTSQTDFGTTTPGSLLSPVTTVFTGTASVSASAGNWVEFTLNTPYPYDPSKTLIVDYDYTSCSGGFNMYSVSSSSPYYHIYSYNNGAPNLYPYIPDFGALVVPAGQATKPLPMFYAPSQVCTGSPVNLLNTSLVNGYNISYQWTITPNTRTFVQGTTAASKSPWVTFNATGTYTVKLKIANNIGVDSVIQTITVGNPTVAPVVDFIGPKRIVARASEITYFKNLTTNCPTSWRWYSPDYQNEFYYNPFLDSSMWDGQAFFAYPGTYDICLEATNAIGTSNVCKADYIRALDARSICNDSVSNDPDGFISDDGGPGFQYGNNKTLCLPNATCSGSACKGFLIDPCASSVTINFEQIKFAAGAGDSVIVCDGPLPTSPRLLALGSGANGTRPTATATSGKMFIYQLTNASGVDSGFVARWSSVLGSYGKPSASFTTPKINGFGTDTFPSGYNILLTNTTTGQDPKYTWDVNGDAYPDSTIANPTTLLYNFTSFPERYTIMLLAYNCKGIDTFYRIVTIMPVTTKPTNLDFTADRLNPLTSDTVRFTETSVGSTGYQWTFTPNSVTYLNGTNANSANPVVKFFGRGYVTVKLKVSNSAGADSLTKVNYINVVNYCVPASSQSTISDIGFNNVSLGTINNTTGTGSLDYMNYYDSSFAKTSLYLGVNYTITLTRNTNALAQTTKAWIDFNIDGDFDDAGELIGSSINSTATTFTYTFAIPAGAKYGSTVMRIGATYGNSTNTGNFLDPCATYLGEFEDYKINMDKDVVKPVITLQGADTIYVERYSSFSDPGATAFDNIEGDISSRIVRTTNFDSTQAGYYYAWYNVTDNYGNAAVTRTRVIVVVLDNTPPNLTLNGVTPMTIHVYTSYNEPGFTAIDNYSGNITSNVSVFGKVDTAKVGTYSLLYDVRDYFGFQTVKTRIVNVVDTVKPVVTGSAAFTHTVNDPFADSMVIAATDNYCTNMSISRIGTVHPNVLGYDTVTYNVTDCNGNAAAPFKVVIHVIDNKAPNIAVAGSDNLTIDVFSSFTPPAATVTDNYYTNLTASIVNNVNTNTLGTYTVVYSAVDGSGNNASKTITVNVVDRMSPVVTLLGENFVTICWGKPYVDPGVQIVDNYYTQAQLQSRLQTTGSVDHTKLGTYCLKYSVTDSSGNASNVVERCVNVEVCDGVQDLNGNSWVVYPNPTKGDMTVKFGKPVGEGVSLKVTNIMGVVVYETKQLDPAASQMQIDLSSYSAGVYFIHLEGTSFNQVQKVNLVK